MNETEPQKSKPIVFVSAVQSGFRNFFLPSMIQNKSAHAFMFSLLHSRQAPLSEKGGLQMRLTTFLGAFINNFVWKKVC